ncbi:MAG: acyl-CoA dehydratase activase [Candidatus Hodarchaeales archaeon]
MNIVAGIDIGSLTAKIVVLRINNGNVEEIFSKIQKVGYNPSGIASKLIEEALNSSSKSKFDFLVSTGYGRRLVKQADKSITEITCHGTGAFFINPKVRTIIDIGGQDSKVIRLNKEGKVQDFEMNDKCSAGTGRFLEVMANALEVKLPNFGHLALKSSSPVSISSTCTVFAESEVISRINQGADRNDVIAGIHKTIANKISALVSRVGVTPTVTLTGGVALNPGVKVMLEEKLNTPIEVPEKPQMTGALGAALIASRKLL